jgi:hypothetical protein
MIEWSSLISELKSYHLAESSSPFKFYFVLCGEVLPFRLPFILSHSKVIRNIRLMNTLVKSLIHAPNNKKKKTETLHLSKGNVLGFSSE